MSKFIIKKIVEHLKKAGNYNIIVFDGENTAKNHSGGFYEGHSYNGSPHEKGCTYTALCEVEKALNTQGIETEIFWIGNKPITGCIGCGACRKLGRCFSVDTVNEFVEKAQSADGFIFGSPVHYAAASGAITSFMDRAFYSGGRFLQGKPAANIVSCRRGGASAAFDQLNKYFTINNMPIVSSQYWNQVHGRDRKSVV